MKFVILAKADSIRCPAKNWRPFHGADSLVDVLIQKLLAVTHPQSIYLSCDDSSRRPVAERFGIHFLLRPRHLADDSVPLESLIRGVSRQVPFGLGEDLAWCFPTDPLFNAHQRLIEYWSIARLDGRDSLLVAYKDDGAFLVDGEFEPIGWQTEPWPHSSKLPTTHHLHFPITITTRALAEDSGRLIGDKPAWFVSDGVSIDINTEAEFRLAQLAYSMQQENVACPS